jgi:hypothetical protein
MQMDQVWKHQAPSVLASDVKILIDSARLQFQKGKRRGDLPDLGPVLTVLDVYGDSTVKAAVSGVRPLIDNRHWLAHGRQWVAPPMVDAAGAWSSIAVLFDALGFPMPEQPRLWV